MRVSFFKMIFSAAIVALGLAWPSDADIQNIVNQVSQPQFTAYQHTIESMGLGQYGGALYDQATRGRSFSGATGDKGNREARKYLVETFANGFGIQSAAAGQSFTTSSPNCPAQRHPENVLIISAHYDTKTPKTPGGDGDASGVAGVLEAARVLSQFKFDNTIRFITFNSTEKGLRGSYNYVQSIVGVRKENLVGAVNLDEILHPYHDKNPALPQALAVGIGSMNATATAFGAAFSAAAQQFVPDLALDAKGPAIDVKGDQFSFITFQYLASLRLSENSSKDIANEALDTAADVSDGTAGAHYDYEFATNVVRATVAFMAQQAGYEGLSDGSVPAFPDSDGDGYSDEIETELASDPASAASTPLNLPAAAPARALELTSSVVSIDFSVASEDAITVAGFLPVRADFVLHGHDGDQPDIAGVVKAFTLKSGGGGKKGVNTFSLRLKGAKNIGGQLLAPFSFTLGQGNFKREFQPLGLINAPFAGKPVTVPFTVIVDNQVRNTFRILVNTSTKDPGGVAR